MDERILVGLMDALEGLVEEFEAGGRDWHPEDATALRRARLVLDEACRKRFLRCGWDDHLRSGKAGCIWSGCGASARCEGFDCWLGKSTGRRSQ